MLQTLPSPVSFDEFIAWYPENAGTRYELALASEPQWEKSSVIENGASVRLVVEVVSTNWRDDYLIKLADYEALAIPEYWVVDYAALGGRRFIGNPKQPMISVYTLIDEEYQVEQFRGDDRITSRAFPDLTLTAAQIFAVR